MTTWCDTTPTPLIEALVPRGEELRNVELISFNPIGLAPYTDPQWMGGSPFVSREYCKKLPTGWNS
jgi:hypothetical protein